MICTWHINHDLELGAIWWTLLRSWLAVCLRLYAHLKIPTLLVKSVAALCEFPLMVSSSVHAGIFAVAFAVPTHFMRKWVQVRLRFRVQPCSYIIAAWNNDEESFENLNILFIISSVTCSLPWDVPWFSCVTLETFLDIKLWEFW